MSNDVCARLSRAVAYSVLAACIIVSPPLSRGARAAGSSPTPSATPAFFLNPAGFDLAMPTNVTAATSSGQCRQNFFLDQQVAACDSGLTAGRVVLVWSYAPATCLAKSKCKTSVSGFNILKSATGPNGPFHLSDTENADPSQLGVALDETIAANRGVCFAVQPYSGSDVGPMSLQPYCVPVLLGPITATPSGFYTTESVSFPNGPYTAAAQGGYATYAENFDFCASGRGGQPPYANGAAIPKTSPGQIIVGYRDNVDTLSSGGKSCPGEDDIWEGAITFDLSRLPSPKIESAKLSMLAAVGHIDRNVGREEVETGESSPACIEMVALASKAAGQTENALFPFYQPFNVPESRGHTEIDITNIVNEWLGGRPNNGLVFAARIDPNAKDTRECVSLYRDIKLTITFKNP